MTQLLETHRHGDVTVLGDSAEVPGIGHLPVNAYVVHADQPVVVDTGLSTPDKDFVSELSKVIDPADVRWIWITHPDRDHTGGLWELLEAAPQARLVTTFLGVGIMSTQWEVPMHRVYFVNPGDTLDIGDRVLLGHRPPLFDNPATVGFLDRSTGAFFSSDCFGAPLSSSELATGGDERDRSGGTPGRPVALGRDRQPLGDLHRPREIRPPGRSDPCARPIRHLQLSPPAGDRDEHTAPGSTGEPPTTFIRRAR